MQEEILVDFLLYYAVINVTFHLGIWMDESKHERKSI